MTTINFLKRLETQTSKVLSDQGMKFPVEGTPESINRALDMVDQARGARLSCSFFDYTYCKEHKDASVAIDLKLGILTIRVQEK